MIQKYLKLYDTYGWIAVASLIVCVVTGVFLIIPYNPSQAYLSVTSFVTSNPAASLTRNIHYWSAQVFLILTILHFFHHFTSFGDLFIKNSRSGRPLKKGVWVQLIISVLVIFYVMLSGFILKDDADSRQAHLLLSGLLSSVPLIGEGLSYVLAGSGKSLMVLYLHHAATATILLFIVTYEHVRSLRVSWATFVYTSVFIIVLGFLFRAPLSQQDEAVMKGPWFFVGIQELLHLIAQPFIVVSLISAFLLLVFLVPFTKPAISAWLKRLVIVIIAMYIVLSVTGYFFRGPFYMFQVPWTSSYNKPVTIEYKPVSFKLDQNKGLFTISGGVEGCMSCHSGMKGLSVSHDPKVTGCYSCHGGDPFTLNKDAAHRNMHLVPGNLQNAQETCGGSGCHDDIIQRVPGSMMASLSGMISVDKWVFGEHDQPAGLFHVSNIKDTPADTHLRNLCAGCHLGMEKTKHGNAGWLDRGGGCNACHLTYGPEALKSLADLNNNKAKSVSADVQFHPAIDINITNDKCESCHSRSGRISLSYSGWHETTLTKLPKGARKESYKVLPDGRILTKLSEDVHHSAGMLCIDCHGSYELMGDGTAYEHKEEAVKVQCQDCHPAEGREFNTKQLSETDRETQLISWIRQQNSNDPPVIITAKDNRPLVNTRNSNKVNQALLIGKGDNKTRILNPASPLCYKYKAHKRLSCDACHTAWVPQCIGCHNVYEKDTKGYDMLRKKDRKGTWVEYTGEHLSEAPVLGIRKSGNGKETDIVGTFSPGMIMTIDHSAKRNSKGTTFHRLYSPVSGHTTVKASRTCESCHLDPLAIGFGRGKLVLSPDGILKFEPEYVLNKHD